MNGLLKKFILETLNEYEEEDPKSYVGVKGRAINLKAGSKLAIVLEPSIFDMISTSYEPIGGHARISSRTHVGNEYPEWVVADIDDDPEPDVAVIGQQSPAGGNKLGAAATDGTSKAKSYLNTLQSKLFKGGGWWSEVSGAMAHITINKLGVKPITDQKSVEKLLGKPIKWHGKHPEGKFPGIDGWYTRNINGRDFTKIIVGDTP